MATKITRSFRRIAYFITAVIRPKSRPVPKSLERTSTAPVAKPQTRSVELDEFEMLSFHS